VKRTDFRLKESLLSRRTNLGELLEVTKPRLILLVLWTVTVGFILAAFREFDSFLLAKTLIGAAFTAGGAMALNQYLERDVDRKMKRTENRPLPSERIQPRKVLVFGIVLALAGLLVLTTGVNALTGFLAALTLGSYLFLYTPLKQKTPLCTLIGAFPGAIPPVLGWTAVRGEMNLEAWTLFFILFVWQIPHFLAISWALREDYTRAGFQILAVLDPAGKRVGREIVLYTIALLPFTLFPAAIGMAGSRYFWGALLLGIWFLTSSIQTARALDERAKPLFRESIVYLGALFLLMLLDKRVA
jgi:protoheme IX farnesyltransferase